MWDSVPWFIGGEAEHSPEVARTLAYLAMNGKEGIVAPGDLRVSAFTVPGAGVNIASGVAGILNKIQSKQAYVGRNPTVDPVQIGATGSSGGRTAMIIGRVLNPNIDGNAPAPADPVLGPYIKSDVITGVPPTARTLAAAGAAGMSAIPLALVTLPANTQTVTNAMITDLRTLANPQETTVVYANLGTVLGTMDSTAYQAFPPYQPTIPVPDWATHARIDLTISQLQAAGNSVGFVTLSARNTAGTTVIGGTDEMSYNQDTDGSSVRFVHLATIYVNISAYQGQNFKPYAHFKKQSANQYALKYDQYSQMVYRVTFYENAV